MLIKNQPWVETFSRSDMVPDIDWNMWQIRQTPFLDIAVGDEVAYACGATPAESRLMWVVRITHLVTERYESHEEAWDLMRTGIPASLRNAPPYPLTRRGFLDQDYTWSKPRAGWLLAFAGEPVRWLDRPRPDDFRFRPNGWGWLPDDSPALKARKIRHIAA